MTKRAHLVLRWIAEIARNPLIVDVVEDTIGPNILCWSTSLFTKEAHTDRFVSWYQDANHWGLYSSSVVSACVALTPSTPLNDCMRFLPGSYLVRLVHENIEGTDNMLVCRQMITDSVDEAAAVLLATGEFALCHVNMAHSSPRNRLSEDRIGIGFRYITGGVYQTKADVDSAKLSCGRNLSADLRANRCPPLFWMQQP
jgi:ectoine hydroxylase-related dioxygenase (phytanoyl-CoA dioxygenase family)